MSQIQTVRDLVNLWPTRADLAVDMSQQCSALSVSPHQVHKWAEKGSIPAKYHFRLLTAAQKRSLPVTADLLVRLHAAGEIA